VKNMTIKNLTIKSKLNIMAVTIVLAVVFIGTYNLFANYKSLQSIDSVYHSGQKVSFLADKVLQPINSLRETSLSIVMAPDDTIRHQVGEGFDNKINSIDSNLEKLKTHTNESNAKDYETLLQMWQSFSKLVKYTKLQSYEGYREGAFINATGPESKQFNALIEHIIKMEGDAMQAADVISVNAQSSADRALTINIFMMLIISIVSSVLLFFIGRTIVDSLKKVTLAMEDIAEGEGDLVSRLDEVGNDEITDVARAFNKFTSKIHGTISNTKKTTAQLVDEATELSHIANATSIDIEQQSSETELVASAVTEMSAASKQVAELTASAMKAVKETQIDTTNGKKSVDDSRQTINILAKEIEEANFSITKLKENSENIGSVLDVINNIAAQTNLLALNAAIEAARAGDQGRGFAVVADEVRTLATRTHESIEEIQGTVEELQALSKTAATKIEDSCEKAKISVEQAEVTSQALQKVEHSVSMITDMNMQIATSAEEQSRVTEEVDRNIVNINSVGKKTAEGAAKTQHIGSKIEAEFNELDRMVGHFKT
jgi:methyl-accepting chemotaxis protein